MLTIALMDEDIIMRLGLTILLDGHFKKIRILEADDLAHYNRLHPAVTPDLFVAGNYCSSKRKSVQYIQSIREQFTLAGLIVYDYLRLQNIINAYVKQGVRGHLLRQNVGIELIDCVKAVLDNQYYISADLSEHLRSTLFCPTASSDPAFY